MDVQAKRQEMVIKFSKMQDKLAKSDFWIYEEDSQGLNFARYFYQRVGLESAVKEIVDSLNGDQELSNSRREKLISAMENCKNFIQNLASDRFIKDNCSFGISEVFATWYKLATKKKNA